MVIEQLFSTSSNTSIKGLTPKEIYEDMVATLQDNAPSCSMVKKWAADFKRGRDSLEDGPRHGRPATFITQEIMDKIIVERS